MRDVQRSIFAVAIFAAAQFLMSCAADNCKCAAIWPGNTITVTTAAGEEVTDFAISIRFPRSDPAYDPRNQSMQPVTFACPDGPNPETAACEGNTLREPFSRRDPYRRSSFPTVSPNLGYMFVVDGKGRWQGMRFEGLKEYDRRAGESVDVGSTGCCSGTRNRSTVAYDVVIAE